MKKIKQTLILAHIIENKLFQKILMNLEQNDSCDQKMLLLK